VSEYFCAMLVALALKAALSSWVQHYSKPDLIWLGST